MTDHWAGVEVLDETSQDFPDRALRLRVRLVREASFKYPFIRLEEAYRLDPATGDATLVAQVAMVADHLIIKPAAGVNEAAFLPAVTAVGGSVRSRKPASRTWLVAVPGGTLDGLPAAVDEFRGLGSLLKIAEPDYIVHADITPDDTSFAQLYGLHNTGQTGGVADADIDAPEAWEITTGSRAIRVGVIDTGIDYTHPDLAANIWTNPAEIAGNGLDDDGNGYVDDVRGWDFVNNDADPMDDHYHGTHCAGTIGAVGGNSLGVVGVNWQVSLVPIKFLGIYGGTTSDAVESVAYATGLGLDLTSNSWGGGGFSQALYDVIAEAGAAGHLFIAAAGNHSANTDASFNYPSSYTLDNIVSVAATDASDQLASFSNYGLASVDLAAPGVATYSTAPGGGYQNLSGTSMATPHVAGAAALILAHRGQITATELKEALLENTDPIPALAGKTVSGGRLNVAAALGTPDALAITSASTTTLTGTPGGPFAPASITYQLRNIGSAPLSWTATDDAPWLDLAPASGTLAPGAQITVLASPSAAALLLTPARHSGVLTFTNTGSGKVRTRALDLLIKPFTEVVFSETFDSGVLNPAFWATSGTGTWQTLVTNLNEPHSGTHHLTMDSSEFGTYARNETTLTLDTSGRSGLRLTFWARLHFFDSADTPPSDPFEDGADFDGLALSLDGVNWHELQPLRYPHLGQSWQQFTLDLDAFLDARTLPYGPTLRLRFNHYAPYEIPFAGLAIDDIRIDRVLTHGLRLVLPESLAENSSPATATLTANPPPITALTVTLASSEPTSLGVPATLTLQPGQTSATFALTPTDDPRRNGTRPVTLTAAATDWGTGSATLQLTDDEAAALTLSAPATLLEGASATATLTVSPAPEEDVTVRLAYSLPDELTVPATVVIPAGQTSVTFPLTALDDTVIDGDLAGTLTATVVGWTSGQATLTTQDNENLSLVLTLSTPAPLHEGSTGRTATLQLSGTRLAPLNVTLASQNPSVLTVPATVVIPAGRTFATFPLTILDDTLPDGAQTSEFTASAPGFTSASLPLTVADDDAHHFTLAPIPGPVVRGAPIPVTLTACDANGDVLIHYPGSLALSAVSGSGAPVAINPTTASGFALGVWSGPLTIEDFATGVVLTAADPAGLTVSSNAFDVGTGSLDHFVWDAVPSPQSLDTPFPVTLRAVDIAGNPITGYSGPVNLGLRLADTAEILSWIPYSDPYEYTNTLAAISRFFTRFHETTTTAITPAELETALVGKHVLLVPAQALATYGALDPIATALAPVLQAFAARGGTVICCSWRGDEHLLLARSGLLDVFSTSPPTFGYLTKSTLTPLNANVATPFYGYFLNAYSNLESGMELDVSLHFYPYGDDVVVSRAVGPGRAILIGTDYFVTDTELDRVIANAVSTSVAAPDSPILSLRAASAAFVAGVWSGSVSMPLTGIGLRLVATSPDGTDGASAPFAVVTPTLPDGDIHSTLTLVLPGTVSEGSSGLSGTVSIPTAPASPLSVTLAAHPPAKLTQPASVTVPAGQTSAAFTFAALDDSFLDGDRLVAVTASAAGHATARRDLVLTDNDTGTLVLTAPTTLAENSAPVAGSISVGAPVLSPLVVTLGSSAPAAATVPATITIPAGATSAQFTITPVNDGALDGPQSTTLTASVPGWSSAAHTLEITDDDARALAFDPTASLYEGATFTASLTLGGTLATDLVVTLAASDPARLIAPATVTIPAGQAGVTFAISAADNAANDGGHAVTLAASAPDYPAITRALGIVDDDLHHFTFKTISTPRATHAPITVTLSARNIDDVILSGYSGGPATLSAAGASGPVGITPAATGSFALGVWSGKIAITDADTAVRVTATLATATGLSNAFDVTLSPALTVTPGRLDVSLPIDGSTTRALTLSNPGGSQLVWRLPSVGLAAPAAEAALAPALAAIPLETILANLNANADDIRAVIPSRYAFTEGVTGTYIASGGDNMYSQGNYLRTGLSSAALAYSDNTLAAAPSSLGAGGRYFTRKFSGLFVFAADIAGLSSFEIDGYLGYGYGSGDNPRRTDTAILTQTRGGVTYKGFVKRVHGGSATPSVNHLVIVADTGSASHTASTYVYEDLHTISGLTGVTRLYYLLYAGTAGAYINDTATQTIFSAFLDAVSSPDFLTVSPASGRLASGSTQTLTVALDAAGLAPGLHERNLTILSNDPARPVVNIPVALTIQDRVLHHFEFDPLPATLVRGAPATIRLRAVDADGLPVATFDAPVALSATGTTLATPVTATGWVKGVWTGRLTPATFAPIATLSADNGAGITGTSAPFAVGTGPLAGLVWDPVASPQAVDTPFPVTVRATDAGGNLLTYGSGPITLSALLPRLLPPTGTAYSTDYYPFYGYAGTARQQALYPASTLGATPRRLTGLALNITSTRTSASFAQWTIRLKNTSATSLSGTSFDANGWSTVHVSTATPVKTGWHTFTFDTPFDYEGVGSLLVEFTFRNPAATSSTTSVSAAYDSTIRTLRAFSSASVDPLTLIPSASYLTPIIQFIDRQPVPLRAPSAALADGVWSGNVSLSSASDTVQLRASSASPAATADSNAFSISATPAPAPALPYSETWESAAFSSAWTITGTNQHRTRISSSDAPRRGTRHLILDTTPYIYTNSRNEATLTLDLAGRNGVVLSFWAKGFNEGANAPATNPFTGGADFDGVAISPDGVTWFEIQPLRSPALTNSWKQFTLNLDPLLAARSWSYTSAFRIRFNRYGPDSVPSDGIAFDDISVTTAPVIAPTITLPASAAESAAPLAGTLSLPAARPADTVFTLSSTAPAKLTLPATVTLPAGQTSIPFTATPLDDAFFDGNRTVSISAKPPVGSGLFSGTATISITDDDIPAFALVVTPASVAENTAAVTATLTLGAPPFAPLTFTLDSSDPTAATVPATLAFAVDQTTATFAVTPIEDTKIDGPQTTTLSASLPGAPPATAAFTVTDNETTLLSLSTSSATEGSTSSGSVSISGTLPSPLIVTLDSANPGQLTVPATVTIPAGSTSASFTLTPINDTATDGTIPVTITATATGFTSASRTVSVLDNDLHHFSFDVVGAQIANRPFTVYAYPRTIDNDSIYGFTGSVALRAQSASATLPVTPATLTFSGNSFVATAITVTSPATGVTLQLDDGAGHTGTSNPFDVGVGAADHFAVSTLASPQVVGAPAFVTLAAQDFYGNTVTSFTGSAALSATAPTSVIGTGTNTSSLPASGSSYVNSRMQVVTPRPNSAPPAPSHRSSSISHPLPVPPWKIGPFA